MPVDRHLESTYIVVYSASKLYVADYMYKYMQLYNNQPLQARSVKTSKIGEWGGHFINFEK